MPSVDKTIKDGEKIISSAESEFYLAVKAIEKKVLTEVNKLFETIDVTSGQLKTNPDTVDFINSLDNRIKSALKSSGYNSSVTQLLTNFDAIKRNNMDVQSVLNGINIKPSALNEITRVEVQNTIDKLLGSGISRDFIIPIRESIYRNVVLGANIKDAQETIRNYIISEDGKESKLLRYTNQVAEDSINQYTGTIQQKIKLELGLSDFIYVGTLITDSRCQCRYWVNKIKLPEDELIDEIDTAVSGGQLGGCTCSGMIPGTTIETFAINKGGYRCRHRAIPTNL